MATNFPSIYRNSASVTAREAEVGNSVDFIDGANLAASCAPGIGVATANIFDKDTVVDPYNAWTTLDQGAAARTPQHSMHIGGSGIGDGNGTTSSITFVTAQVSPGAADVNDTANFVEADTIAADGAGPLLSDPTLINVSGKTVRVGERVWTKKVV